MDLEEAKRILRAADIKSHARFSEQEQEAILVIGVAVAMGEMTEVEVSRLMLRFDA